MSKSFSVCLKSRLALCFSLLIKSAVGTQDVVISKCADVIKANNFAGLIADDFFAELIIVKIKLANVYV